MERDDPTESDATRDAVAEGRLLPSTTVVRCCSGSRRWIDRLSDANIAVSFAPVLLGVVLVLGVLLGFLAALIPARRSTHQEVLEAIQAV